jgi:hypothetical protein
MCKKIEQVCDNDSNIQQSKIGWWDGDNFIPLTKVMSLHASRFGINIFKQNNEIKTDQLCVLVC